MSTDQQDALAAEFEQHRRHLRGVAYRLLGTLSDAEDVVQDAWLRLARSDRARIEDLAGWLTTVISRLCLDRLRSVRVRRETYVGPWLPEPVVVSLRDQVPDPATVVEVDDSVRLALLTVLEELTPEQRVALVLHDVFAVPFDEVADVLGTTAAAARQLASRARRAVRERDPAPLQPPAHQREVLEAFRRAATQGDLAALVAVLAPDTVLRADGGGRVRSALRPVVGAEPVARFLLGLVATVADGTFALEVVAVNGELGALVRSARPGEPEELTLLVPHAGADGVVHGIDVVRNPDKLRGLR